jgi:hypothetical protein
VNTKRGFYFDAWIPTPKAFGSLEDKIYVVDAYVCMPNKCIRCHDHSEKFTRRKSCLDATPKFILNSKSRHGMRSRFNAAGLITFDCQDARDRSQRTYIDGFMTKDDALKLSDSLIPLPIMCLSLYQRYSWHRCSRIAMCTERAIIENQIYACRQRCVLHFAYQVGLSPEVLESENIVIFRCFDPVWGRGATVEQGLYDSVTISWN